MQYGRNEINTGMVAYGSDGEKLGKVIETGNTEFVIEKGFFSPKDFLLPYSCIDRVQGDDLHLSLTKEQVTEGRWGERAQTSTASTAGTDEIRVPLREEQVDVIKERREAGSVNVRKEVTTEEKQFTVPVTRESVTVERVPATGDTRAASADTQFQEENIRVPVHEEEVEIRKRPVVREEVRVATERHTEERPVEETIRREEVEVDRSDEPLHAGKEDEGYKF